MRFASNPNKILSALFFIFLAFIFIRPFVSEMAYPIAGGFLNIALLALLFIYILFFKEFQFSGNTFAIALLLYIFSISISLFFSINLRSSIYQIYQLIPLLCLFFFTSNLKKEQNLKLVHVVLLSASIISAYTIYQYLWGFEHTREYLNLNLKNILRTTYAKEILLTRRAIGTFFSPNMLGSFIAMTIPLCLGTLFENKNNKKIWLFLSASLAVMLIALLFTKSIAAWTSLSFGVIIFFIFMRKSFDKIALIICIFTLLMSISLLLLRSNMFIDLMNQQNTILQRLAFWKSSLKIIKEFPFVGIGLGNFENIYTKYRELIANETRFAHNILLQTWIETGLLGLFSVVLLVTLFVKISFKIEKTFFNIGLIASCYVFFINNLFDFSYFIPQVSFLFWINLGMISQKPKIYNIKLNSKIKAFVGFIIFSTICLNTRSLIALNYFRNGEYNKAISLESYNDLYHAAANNYDKAIFLNPYSPFYHKKLGLSHLSKNMTKEAIVEFEKASKLYPANTYLHQKLFVLYKETNEIEKAKKEEAKLKEFRSKYSGYFIR